jgi:hypothetical protein
MNDNTNYHVIRSIRGPITLITLGSLFALQNFTRFGFDQTWPVLLIVFGLLSLLQRGAAPPRMTQMPPFPPTPPPVVPPIVPPPPRPYSSASYSQSPYAGGGPTPPPADPGSSQGGTV